MADDKRARFKQWLANGEACLHPLTFPQRELWETSIAPPADVSNHICCVINVRGLISPEDCMWDLLATGPRADQQRDAIERAIGPIWEADHVWLILIVVILFTAFPPAFTAMMTALNIPFTLMLIGIVLRGSAFIFRKYDIKSHEVKRGWSLLFGAASFFTPFIQGLTLGALSTGQIRIADGHVVSGFFAGWLTPFAFACGLFALALFAFLAATYLTVDPSTERHVQNDFRLRALCSGVALGPIAFVVFIASKHENCRSSGWMHRYHSGSCGDLSERSLEPETSSIYSHALSC